MTEPAQEGGAGSDPSMLNTTAHPEGGDWIINGCKTFISGAVEASVGIVMARSTEGATMFLVDLPNPAVRIERVLDTIDGSMAGGHSVVHLDHLHFPDDQVLGAAGRDSSTHRSVWRRRGSRIACTGMARVDGRRKSRSITRSSGMPSANR